MDTILSQLPAYIDKYPPSDQAILNEFLSVLQSYEVDTQAARKQLLEHFEKFIRIHRSSGRLWDLPFLWFAESYFTNAYKLLSVARFHADNFYEYFVKQLRSDSYKSGVFQFIRRGTPLADLEWEKLQYACNKLSVPLTSEELHVLEIIHALCMETGILTLNQNYIKTNIINQVKSPTLLRKLASLFSRLDSQWLLQFYTPAFDLALLIFRFQLNESTSLKEIIDFHDSANTTLCYSDVHWIRGFHNMYCGIFVVPTQLVEPLREFLQYHDRQGHLILYDLEKVTTSRICTSLSLYQATKGWRTLTQTEWRRLVQLLKTQRPRKRRTRSMSFYITPSLNKYWHYSQHPDPLQIISLYCKSQFRYSFGELPFGSNNEQITPRLSKPELDLIKELYLKKVAQVWFRPLRLIHEFSLDYYWIKLPNMPFDQLSRLLAWLPYAYLCFTENNIHIWSFLIPKLAEWFRTDLEWTVMQIVRKHPPQMLNFDWYSPEARQWRAPLILTM